MQGADEDAATRARSSRGEAWPRLQPVIARLAAFAEASASRVRKPRRSLGGDGTGRPSIPEASVIEPKGRGVLDHPLSRVMTPICVRRWDRRRLLIRAPGAPAHILQAAEIRTQRPPRLAL